MAHRAGSRCGRLPAPPRPCSELRAHPTSCPSRRAGRSVLKASLGSSSRRARRQLPGRDHGLWAQRRGPARTCPPPAGEEEGEEGAGGGSKREGEDREERGRGMHRESRRGAGAEVGQRRGKVSLDLPGPGTCPSHEWGPGNRCVRLRDPGAGWFADRETSTLARSPAPRLHRLPGGRTRPRFSGARSGARADVVNFTTPAPLCSLEITGP